MTDEASALAAPTSQEAAITDAGAAPAAGSVLLTDFEKAQAVAKSGSAFVAELGKLEGQTRAAILNALRLAEADYAASPMAFVGGLFVGGFVVAVVLLLLRVLF
jgi:hypothetical protein